MQYHYTNILNTCTHLTALDVRTFVVSVCCFMSVGRDTMRVLVRVDVFSQYRTNTATATE